MMAMRKVGAALVLGAMCLPVATTAREAKTAARWLETIRDQPLQQPDAKLADLQRGCMLEVTYRPMFKTKWDEDRRQCLERYRNWVSDKGNALIDKWLGGETPTGDERLHLPILKATYMFRVWNTKSGGGPRKTRTPEAPDEYVKRVAERGERILRKGFLGRHSPIGRPGLTHT